MGQPCMYIIRVSKALFNIVTCRLTWLVCTFKTLSILKTTPKWLRYFRVRAATLGQRWRRSARTRWGGTLWWGWGVHSLLVSARSQDAPTSRYSKNTHIHCMHHNCVHYTWKWAIWCYGLYMYAKVLNWVIQFDHNQSPPIVLQFFGCKECDSSI